MPFFYVHSLDDQCASRKSGVSLRALQMSTRLAGRSVWTPISKDRGEVANDQVVLGKGLPAAA